LVFDVEGGVQYTPSRKVLWDPREKPPVVDEQVWDTCVVVVRDADTMRRAFAWLTAGQHPFRSIVIDSLTEVQKRFVDEIAGVEQPKLQDYGAIARQTEAIVRGYRDLTMRDAPHPVDVVVFVCGTAEKGTDHPVMRPMLIGSMAEKLAYNLDVVAYLAMTVVGENEVRRTALFMPTDGIVAKDRTGQLGVAMDAPSIPKMLEKIEAGLKSREEEE
jgi:hypothetical protein